MHPLASFGVFASVLVLVGALSTSSNCVSTISQPGSIPLATSGEVAPIFIAPDEWPAVQRVADDFVKDIKRVTGATGKVINVTSPSITADFPKGNVPVLVGTLGHSSLVDSIISHAENNVVQPFTALKGSWEAYHAQIVSNPLPGVDRAYVIVGSDRRGTIYALYELSEQMGVSPWFWWADVPVRRSKSLFLTVTPCAHGTPTVKYRGIFLNDEQPSLQNWAQEKFSDNFGAPAGGAVGGDDELGAMDDPTEPKSGTKANVPFNRFFYAHLYELILRLKGNYLWPAQWGAMFGIDDSLNQFWADYYGIVMGTSHEEPMMRSIPNEWNSLGHGQWDFSTNEANVTQFWIEGTVRSKNLDEIYTVGMRGNGDEPLSEGQNIGLLQHVVDVQRNILAQVYNTTDVSSIPQVWTLYKEVEGFYGKSIVLNHGDLLTLKDDGMRVPDDITLLWSDDNWGNIRRFPLPSERNRTGGSGVYYHIDYVGDPRDYKWIQSSQISKMYEQLSLAIERDAKQIWVLNVGDLKPGEMATEFFIALGYNSTVFTPETLDAAFTQKWASREFGLNQKEAVTAAQIMNNVTRWNARKKPELLDKNTYNLINYREADRVLADWDATVSASTAIYNSLPGATKPAFFQLVHHPVLASANLQKLYIIAGKNNLFASQARLSTNDLADEVEQMFEADYDLEEQYHTILDGKWNHIMDQTHIGYAYWQQPMQNSMPSISRVHSRKQALPGPMRLAIEGSMGAWPGDNVNNCAAGFNCPPPTLPILDPFNPVQSRWIDVSAGGPHPFTWNVTSNTTWVKVVPSSGSISPKKKEQRLEVSVDWSELVKTDSASLTFNAVAKGQVVENQQIMITAEKTVEPNGFHGFIEGDGTITMEAAHASRNVGVNGVSWQEIPNYGRTLSGMTPLPILGNNDKNFSVGAGPKLEYDFVNFHALGKNMVNVSVLVSLSFNGYGDDRPLKFATQIDEDTPQVHKFFPDAAPGQLPKEWNGFASDSIINVASTHTAAPGTHTFRIFMIEPAVVIQKIVINTGGVKSSFLGPPESVQV